MQIKLKVIPKAKIDKIIKLDNNYYKIHTTSPPDKGKANQSVIKLLSKELNIPKSKFTIIKGKKSRTKTISLQK